MLTLEDLKELAIEEKYDLIRQAMRYLLNPRKVHIWTCWYKGVKSVYDSGDLKMAAEQVKTSTASLGKFQPKLGKKLEQQAAKVKLLSYAHGKTSQRLDEGLNGPLKGQ